MLQVKTYHIEARKLSLDNTWKSSFFSPLVWGLYMRNGVLKMRLLQRLTVLVAICVLLQVAVFSSANAEEVRFEIQEALNQGDTAAAINLINRDIETDPAYHFNYYLLGLIHWERQQYNRARDQFKLAFEAKDNHYETAYYLAKTHIILGELDEADKLVELGMKKAKKMKAQFNNALGLLQLARKNYSEADRAFRTAIAENSADEEKTLKDLRTKRLEDAEREKLMAQATTSFTKQAAEYQINLGDANFYQGVPTLAIIEYEKALAVDTGSLEVYYHWAEACIEMKDYQCAMEKLRVVLQKDSTHAPAWMRAGGIYFKVALSTRQREDRRARFVDAIGAYKRYLELGNASPDSTSVRAYFEIAMAYANIGGFEDAAHYFEQVLAIPYEPRDIYFNYGKALWGIKDYEKSAQILTKHIDWVEAQEEDNPSRASKAELYQLLGDDYYYRESKNYALAAQNYRKSLDERPDQKRITYNIAVAYHNEKDYVNALHFYDKRIEMGVDSTYLGIYKNAGYCALNYAKGDVGGDDDEALEEDEDMMDAPVEEAAIDLDRNYFEVAAAYFEEYLKFKPDDQRTVLLLAQTYAFDMADCTRAVEAYNRVLVLDPNNFETKRALGYLYFGGICTKSYTRAIGYLKDAYNIMKDDPEKGACADSELLLWVAQAYHLRAVDKKDGASDDFKAANVWYKRCKDCDPSNTLCKKGYDDTSFEF